MLGEVFIVCFLSVPLRYSDVFGAIVLLSSQPMPNQGLILVLLNIFFSPKVLSMCAAQQAISAEGLI